MKAFQILAVFCLLASTPALGAGSWSQTEPGPRLGVPGQVMDVHVSPPDPAPLAGRQIHRVRWRFEHSPAASGQFQAWLCHQHDCLPIETPFGQTQALAGGSATEPLFFRFRLLPGQRGSVQIRSLQAIVDFR